MADALSVPQPNTAPLSEVQRVVDTFTAPSKTFTDILRSSAFLGPLVIMILVSVSFAFAVQQKVGWQKVYENILHQTPATEEKFAQMKPEQAENTKAVAAKVTGVTTYAYTVVVLIFTAINGLLVWVTANFIFGGKATFGQIFAVNLYASLVMNIKYLLAIVSLFAGLAPDSFLLQNPVGTNIGFYLSQDAPKALTALCMHLDLFEIWSLVLASIGVAIVAKISTAKAATAVVGWWAIFVLIGVASAALSS
ncbi:YIP1 family protein [Silvibacterium sp.]|uniref:YIP1 family protein n=1 Tax=Silvibacterium sp. TaxID=1964179 RepID=UPI0039E21CF3